MFLLSFKWQKLKIAAMVVCFSLDKAYDIFFFFYNSFQMVLLCVVFVSLRLTLNLFFALKFFFLYLLCFLLLQSPITCFNIKYITANIYEILLFVCNALVNFYLFFVKLSLNCLFYVCPSLLVYLLNSSLFTSFL